MRVLLIGQDAATAASVKMMLIGGNIFCDTTDLGDHRLKLSKPHDYDVILVDLRVPNINVYRVLRQLRRARVRTPVVILSGLAELDHRIKDLGFDEDDFVSALCDRGELIAQGRAAFVPAMGRIHKNEETMTGRRRAARSGGWRRRLLRRVVLRARGTRCPRAAPSQRSALRTTEACRSRPSSTRPAL